MKDVLYVSLITIGLVSAISVTVVLALCKAAKRGDARLCKTDCKYCKDKDWCPVRYNQ